MANPHLKLLLQTIEVQARFLPQADAETYLFFIFQFMMMMAKLGYTIGMFTIVFKLLNSY